MASCEEERRRVFLLFQKNPPTRYFWGLDYHKLSSLLPTELPKYRTIYPTSANMSPFQLMRLKNDRKKFLDIWKFLAKFGATDYVFKRYLTTEVSRDGLRFQKVSHGLRFQKVLGEEVGSDREDSPRVTSGTSATPTITVVRGTQEERFVKVWRARRRLEARLRDLGKQVGQIDRKQLEAAFREALERLHRLDEDNHDSSSTLVEQAIWSWDGDADERNARREESEAEQQRAASGRGGGQITLPAEDMSLRMKKSWAPRPISHLTELLYNLANGIQTEVMFGILPDDGGRSYRALVAAEPIRLPGGESNRSVRATTTVRTTAAALGFHPTSMFPEIANTTTATGGAADMLDEAAAPVLSLEPTLNRPPEYRTPLFEHILEMEQRMELASSSDGGEDAAGDGDDHFVPVDTCGVTGEFSESEDAQLETALRFRRQFQKRLDRLEFARQLYAEDASTTSTSVGGRSAPSPLPEGRTPAPSLFRSVTPSDLWNDCDPAQALPRKILNYAQDFMDTVLERVSQILGLGAGSFYVDIGVGFGAVEHYTRFLRTFRSWQGLIVDVGHSYARESVNYRAEMAAPGDVLETFQRRKVPENFELLVLQIDSFSWHVLRRVLLSSAAVRERRVRRELRARVRRVLGIGDRRGGGGGRGGRGGVCGGRGGDAGEAARGSGGGAPGTDEEEQEHHDGHGTTTLPHGTVDHGVEQEQYYSYPKMCCNKVKLSP